MTVKPMSKKEYANYLKTGHDPILDQIQKEMSVYVKRYAEAVAELKKLGVYGV